MRQTKYCLLLEDDPEDQELFMEALQQVSPKAQCYAVFNGEEALGALTRDDFMPDCIFTDINMPKMDGFEFLKNLRSMPRFNNIPVVVYSSDFSQRQIERIRPYSVAAFHSKTRMGSLKDILKAYFSDRPIGQTIL